MKIRILATMLLCSILTSCSDFFELERDRPDLPEWQTVGDMNGMLTSTYKYLFTNGGWNNPIGVLSNYTELVHDLSMINPGGAWTFGDPLNGRLSFPFNQSNLAPGKIISGMYKSISSSNTIISFIQEVRDGKVPLMSNLSPADQLEMNRICGEAHFMRGFAYWMVSLAYMPPYSTENKDTVYVPYITERYYTETELLSPPMGTMGMIYSLMLNDFANAKAELELAGTSDEQIQNERRGFANKYAASAMLMRLYFVMQNWDKALAECEYIEAGPYDLNEQPIRAFNRNLDSTNPIASEVIFEAAYTLEGANANTYPAIGRITKIGKSSAKNKAADIALSKTDENWTGSGRGASWSHQMGGALYWNPNTLRDIGWAEDDTDTSTDALSFKLSADAQNDLRCTQLHYFLKPFMTGGDAKEFEMTYTSTTWDALWNDKYLRGPVPMYTQLPLIRLAEVKLTKASCIIQGGGDNATALDAVNEVRTRAYGEDTYNLTGTITEGDVEKERIKEMAFEIGDRLTYLAAMRLPIASNGKVVIPGTTAFVAEIAHPYNGFHIQLPDIEYLYSSTAGQSAGL